MIDKRGQFALCTGAVVYGAKNKQEGSPWVVLPVANFDAYFGTTAFSKKWLTKIPATFMERQNQHFGVCRYRVGEEWVGVKIQQ